MNYEAIILADSISPTGARLTTMEVTFPRMVLAEFNTHRMFSRNSASSRAIPVEKMLDKVRTHPFIPVRFGKNQKGMQASEWLAGTEHSEAVRRWYHGRDRAIETAEALLAVGVHKQLVNRVLEPYLWHTVIVTATEWSNFFALRDHPDAQPEIQIPAHLMKVALANSSPRLVEMGDWHRPLMPDLEELATIYVANDLNRISAGRCARVSYTTHHGTRDPEADIELCERLVTSGHMSPLEHVATPLPESWMTLGNFKGWEQMRKAVPYEADFGQIGNSPTLGGDKGE